jgi:hypothetical protein
LLSEQLSERLRPAKGLKRLAGRKVRPSSTGPFQTAHDRKEIALNAKPILTRPHVAATIVAAVLSAFIAIGFLCAVAGLFQRDGTPLAQIVIAERACADYAFVSERETCMRLFLAASRVQRVASR